LRGGSYSGAPAVYDDARHRLWFRIEAREEGRPPSTQFVLLLLTEKGALQIAAVAPAGDPGLGWRGQRAARKALRRWLKDLRAAPLAGEATASLTAAPA